MADQEANRTETRMTAPAISVVMGVYNGGDAVLATIESVLDQSFRDFEFIIVDDGSTDGSREVLADFATGDERIVVVSQPNGGLTNALIAGCKRARGEVIARQDVGDRSLPTRFERQYDYLSANAGVVAVGAGCRRIGPAGEFLGEASRDVSPEEVTRGFLEDGIGISHTVAMFRRSAYEQVGGYRKQFRFAQDTDLWFRMTRVGKLAELPEILFEWGIDVDGISSASHDRQRRLATLARESFECGFKGGQDDSCILEDAEATSWKELPPSRVILPRDARANAEFFIGSQLYTLGDGRCREYLKRAIAQRPFRARPWAKLFFSYLKRQSSRA